MIKIIREGKIRKRTCENCGCYFQHEDSDVCDYFRNGVQMSLIKCPQCGTDIVINVSNLFDFGQPEEEISKEDSPTIEELIKLYGNTEEEAEKDESIVTEE